MKDEYYRIVIENGKIKINIFDRGNPIPTFSTNCNMENEKARELVALFLQKYGLGIKEYQEICNRYEREMTEDIKSFLNKDGKFLRQNSNK